MALRNTDEDETMPMYTPKLRELAPEPVEHPHPLPELDPKAIAPDGVANSRTKTQPLPPSWLKALVGLSVLLTVACGPSTILEPTVEWDQLESCYLFCDAAQEECGGRGTCWDDCGGAVERVTDACRPLAVSWYTCMARPETTMICSAWPIPISQDCDDYLRLYHDCQFGVDDGHHLRRASVFLIVIPSLALAVIVNHGTTNERLMQICRQRDRHMTDVLHDYLACANHRNALQAERDTLWLLVDRAIGTTEAAISEITDDEEDTADAKEYLARMKEAIGMDPKVEAYEQDPQVFLKVEQEYAAARRRLKEQG